MTAYTDYGVQLRKSHKLVARAHAPCHGGQWLKLNWSDTERDDRGSVSFWLPDPARVERIAAAINAAWDEPGQKAAADTGRTIPLARLDVLRGADDGPEEAA